MQKAAPSASRPARAFAPRPRVFRPGASPNAANTGKPASPAAAGRASTCPGNVASPSSRGRPLFERFRALVHRLLGRDPSEVGQLMARPGELPLGVMAGVEVGGRRGLVAEEPAPSIPT